MTKKALILAMVTVFLTVAGLAGLLVAADAPDKVNIQDPLFDKPKKGPVALDHKKHVEVHKVGCNECHHPKDYDGKTSNYKQGDPTPKCSECHKAEKTDKIDKLQNAFHNNCKECHKKIGKGPEKKCNECHAEKQ